ncbi:MAG: DJ-1/PfpI family protein [Myxococcota bacterium]
MATLHLGFVVFPNVTQLDLTGPLQMLSRLPGCEAHVVAASLEPVPTDCPFAIVPSTTYDDCPPLHLLCIPGGFGTAGAIADGRTVDFVRAQGAWARLVTSVCTGAFVLGAAGLLDGRMATTHWAYHDLLSVVGAVPTEGRVVVDDRAEPLVITGGGVTAGIDFGLRVAAQIAGEDVAQAIQLGMEYDPDPPFDAGHPRSAPPAVREGVRSKFGARKAEFAALLHAARHGPRRG